MRVRIVHNGNVQKRILIGVGLAIALAVAGAFYMNQSRQGPRSIGYNPVLHPIAQTLLVTGRVAPPARVQLGAMVQSTVVEVHVDEGEVVEVGTLLASLADDEAGARVREAEAQVAEAAARLRRVRGVGRQVASARVAEARAAAQEAEQAYDRAATLFAQGAHTEAQYDLARRAKDVAASQLVAAELEAAASTASGADTEAAAASLARAQASLEVAQAGLERTRLRAPTRGQVLVRSVEVGQVVRPGDVLLTFAGEGALDVRITPNEFHLGQLEVGQTAKVVTEAFPDRPVTAQVSRIAPGVDASRGTVEVRLTITGEVDDVALRPDMTATVEVLLGERDEALVIPTWLVHDLGTRNPWAMVAQDGVAERRPLILGLEGTDSVEVVSGLTQTDVVLPHDADVVPGDPVRTRVVEPAIPVGG